MFLDLSDIKSNTLYEAFAFLILLIATIAFLIIVIFKIIDKFSKK
jgi:hypothetical protein